MLQEKTSRSKEEKKKNKKGKTKPRNRRNVSTKKKGFGKNLFPPFFGTKKKHMQKERGENMSRAKYKNKKKEAEKGKTTM